MRHVLTTRLWWPPLLRELPPALGLLNVVAPPLLWGVLCGVLSGVSHGAFLSGVVLSFVGAFAAGRQHDGRSAGLTRGFVAGTLFGLAILLGHAVHDAGALVLEPPFLQVAFTATVAASLGALGGNARGRELHRGVDRRRPMELS